MQTAAAAAAAVVLGAVGQAIAARYRSFYYPLVIVLYRDT